ncbi:MAG: PIN domain nuclease [Deltaproteobacteria bacterium]|nr:PIN domain nuclease [Deltaproteobacteria bacterium]MBW1937281.1 PIN domain nuclease [Deltaproteobacteria bacterium]MBW1964352.1 PIN domain nuclease [Deltaproteobacteria bacterium]MBW2079591.1 PIN domain nuclease [Deltaproteobacteria bacterium]MBW2350768.1 PIN domain nuclease [Deltaproteobacteria bacterium]
MILVDSSVWIDYFNGISTWQTDSLDNYLSNVPVVIGDLILTEVLQGFRSNKDFETAKNFLGALPFRQIGGYNVAIQSAQNYRSLRKAGVTVRKTIDVIIATFCIIEGLTLLHDDRDFDPMESHFFLKTLTPP